MKRKLLFGLVGIVALVALAGAYFLRVAKILVGSNGNPLSIWDPHPEERFPKKDRITLLLIGKDYNYTKSDQPFSKSSRSDTILLMALDLKQRTMSAVSIPRDSHVVAPDGKEGKINGTFARGGIKLLEQTIDKLYGVMPDYYVIIKDTAVKNIVDSLNGVDVEALDAMKYDDNWGHLHIDLPRGRQHLTGDQAVGFVRFREVKTYELDAQGNKTYLRNVVHSAEEGDLRRTARQQQMIKAMLTSATSPSNLLRAPQIIQTAFDQFDTNMSHEQILALGTMFKGANHGEMLSATLPGKDLKAKWGVAFELDKPKSQAIVDWLIKGQENRAKDTLAVNVYNGADINGAVKQTVALLAKNGFDAKNGGNMDDVVDKTTVIYHKSAFEPIAKQIGSMVGATSVLKQPQSVQDEANEVTVNIGLDFDPVKVGLKKPVATTARRPRHPEG